MEVWIVGVIGLACMNRRHMSVSESVHLLTCHCFSALARQQRRIIIEQASTTGFSGWRMRVSHRGELLVAAPATASRDCDVCYYSLILLTSLHLTHLLAL